MSKPRVLHTQPEKVSTSIPIARSTPVVPPRLYRIEQAADYLNCTISFMETLYREGTIKPVDLRAIQGGIVVHQKRTLFDIQDLDAYVELMKASGP